jgi:hypothetical protein
MFGASLLTFPLISCKGASLDPLEGMHMPFEKLGDENLDAVVNVRLTADEKEQLRDDAELAGISVSALVRRRYFGKPIIANADIVMVKELRRLGGLLKQVHTSSEGAYSKTTAAALQEIKNYIEKLSHK